MTAKPKAGAREAQTGAVEVPQPVVFVPARPIATSGLPADVLRLLRLAEAAGWSARATYAMAGAVELHRVPIGDEVGERTKGERKTVDELRPVVLHTIALRCRRAGRSAVAVWHNGAYSQGFTSDPLALVGVRAFTAYLRAPTAVRNLTGSAMVTADEGSNGGA